MDCDCLTWEEHLSRCIEPGPDAYFGAMHEDVSGLHPVHAAALAVALAGYIESEVAA